MKVWLLDGGGLLTEFDLPLIRDDLTRAMEAAFAAAPTSVTHIDVVYADGSGLRFIRS